jgi:hypothetical protein
VLLHLPVRDLLQRPAWSVPGVVPPGAAGAAVVPNLLLHTYH